MLFFIHYQRLGVIRAAPRLDIGLNVLVRRVLCIRWFANAVFVRQRVVSRRNFAAARMIVRPLHRMQNFTGVLSLAGFEEKHFESVCGQDVGSHAAASAGADDHGIIGRFQIYFRIIGSGKLQQHALLALYAPEKIGTDSRA